MLQFPYIHVAAGLKFHLCNDLNISPWSKQHPHKINSYYNKKAFPKKYSSQKQNIQ